MASKVLATAMRRTTVQVPPDGCRDLIVVVPRAGAPTCFVSALADTTEASAEKKMEGKAACATGWVVKPFSPDRLLATIARIVA